MAIGDEFKSSGITENTPKTIMLGAGTIHKGLAFTKAQSGGTGEWNFKDSLICATSGGSKLSITPEFYDVPVDGALVKIKGLTAKVGETATLEINPVELTPAVLKMAVLGDSKTSTKSLPARSFRPEIIFRIWDMWAKPSKASRLSLFLITPFALPALSWRARTRKRRFRNLLSNALPTFPRKPIHCRGIFIIPRRLRVTLDMILEG